MKSGRRKNILFIAALSILLAGCSPQTTGPQRIIENGIEIVVNGPSIYPDGGRMRGISLREEFRIDIEDAAMAAAGLTDVSTLDFDSHGRLYVFKHGANSGPVVFRFDKSGKFSKSFVTIGQGPGEVENPEFLSITSRDETPIKNENTQSLQYFDPEGRLLRSIQISGDFYYNGPKQLALLPNDDYLIRYIPVDRNMNFDKICVGIFNARFKLLKNLAEYGLPKKPDLESPFPKFPITAISINSIFVGSYVPGDEISVFNLQGELKRKIQVRYPTAQIPADFKKTIFAALPSGRDWRTIMKFPKSFPHYQEFFADDEDRLYGVSFEKHRESGANFCDIFSPDGVRIARAALGYHDYASLMSISPNFDVVIRNSRLACVRAKANDFKEIIVYSMIWS
jgi:hypothetical protein